VPQEKDGSTSKVEKPFCDVTQGKGLKGHNRNITVCGESQTKVQVQE
jgi:hypothetical protein